MCLELNKNKNDQNLQDAGEAALQTPSSGKKKKKRSQINDLNFHLEILAEEKQINSKFSKQKESKKDQRRNQKSQKNDSSQ